MGSATPFDEFSADPDKLSALLSGRSHQGTTMFNPVVDRHLRYNADLSLENIGAGKEILDNYLAFSGGEAEHWNEDVKGMRKLCSGEEVGEVTSYERSASDKKEQ